MLTIMENSDKSKRGGIRLKSLLLCGLITMVTSISVQMVIRHYDHQKKLPYWETAEYLWYSLDGTGDSDFPTIVYVVGTRVLKDYRWDGGPDFALIYKSDTPAEDLEAYEALFVEQLVHFAPSAELSEEENLFFCYDHVLEGEVRFRVRAYLLEDGYKIVYDPYPRTE